MVHEVFHTLVKTLDSVKTSNIHKQEHHNEREGGTINYCHEILCVTAVYTVHDS